MNPINNNIVGNAHQANINIDEYEVIDANEPQKGEDVNRQAGGFDENVGVPGQGRLPGPVLLRGSELKPYVAPPDLKAELNAAIEDRYSVGNFFAGLAKAVGRKFMNMCHAVKCFFCPSLNAKGVASFDTAVMNNAPGRLTNSREWKNVYENREGVDESPSLLAHLEQGNPGAYTDKSISLSNEEIGAAFGLRGEVKVAKFNADEVNFIRAGQFSLQDIKQDPDLQDCWFLSTLSSVLVSCGKGPLTNIIHVPPDTTNNEGQKVPPDHAFVKLGQNVYKVPLGEVQTKDGDKSVSDSKPWVKLLETAMQMHLVKTSSTINEKNVRMSYRNSQDGFAALFGVSRKHAQESVIGGNPLSQTSFETLNRLFTGNRPIVLGSKNGVGAALGTGISPGHAVAVLDVDSEKRQVTVLDPYGHTRLLQEKDLSNFIMVAALPERGRDKDTVDGMVESGEIASEDNAPEEYKWRLFESVIIDRIGDNYPGKLNDPVEGGNNAGGAGQDQAQYVDTAADDF